MSKIVLPKHGRQHCPGGSDPIPCFPSSWGTRWPFPLFSAAQQRRSVNWIRVALATTPNGAVVNNFQDNYGSAAGLANYTPADGDYFIVAARLGPVGSHWSWDIGVLTGPDYGIVGMQRGMVTENTDGSTISLDDVTFASGGVSMDCYSASLFADVRLGQFGQNLTFGQDGIWAFKFYVNGKNGSSSHYKAAFWELSIARYDEGPGFGVYPLG